MNTGFVRVDQVLKELLAELVKAQDVTMTVVDAAKYLGMSRRSLDVLVAEGSIASYKVLSHRMFYKSELDRFIRAQPRSDRADGLAAIQTRKFETEKGSRG